MSTALRKGAGRPLLNPLMGELMQTVTFRATKEQHAKFIALGGGDWVRDKLDRTKMPAAKGGK